MHVQRLLKWRVRPRPISVFINCRCKRPIAAAFLLITPFVTSVNASPLEAGAGAAAFSVEVSGSGRPLILIPGLSSGGVVWDDIVAHFKDQYECHVVTIAGFAGQPSIKDEPFLERVRDALIAYVRAEQLAQPIIVGHSLGGFLAFWIASEAPTEIGPIVAVDGVPYLGALLIPGATPELVTTSAEAMRKMMEGQTQEQFAMGNRLSLSQLITRPEDLDRILESSNESDPKTVAKAMYEIMTTDLREKVQAIESPVLIIGALGTISSSQLEGTKERYRNQVSGIRNHKVVFALKARHFIQLDEPEFLIQQMEEFLESSRGL